MKILILLLTAGFVIGQNKTDNISAKINSIDVYMDAPEHLKTEIPYINYVRNLNDANLNIIKTEESSGSGGSKLTYYLYGLKELTTMNDTIEVYFSPNSTVSETREKSIEFLKLGLIRYILHTPLAENIQVIFNTPNKEVNIDDPWNNWVFTPAISTDFHSEKLTSRTDIQSSISISKINIAWKFNLNGSYNVQESRFELGEENDNVSQQYKSVNKSKQISTLLVRSIGKHWGVGVQASISSSIFSNYNTRIKIMPGVEYSIFPYSRSSTKRLVAIYNLGVQHNDYIHSTIYNKTKESLIMQRLEITLNLVQKWGDGYFGIDFSNYMHDWNFYYLGFYTNFTFKIYKGLAIDIGSRAALIHDQLNLVKEGASDEEILLQRKELATQFNFDSNFQISYTFGSIFNNIVNSRWQNR